MTDESDIIYKRIRSDKNGRAINRKQPSTKDPTSPLRVNIMLKQSETLNIFADNTALVCLHRGPIAPLISSSPFATTHM